MSIALPKITHAHLNAAWLAKHHEDIIEPALPIIDRHRAPDADPRAVLSRPKLEARQRRFQSLGTAAFELTPSW
jgi:hypothetical protein